MERKIEKRKTEKRETKSASGGLARVATAKEEKKPQRPRSKAALLPL